MTGRKRLALVAYMRIVDIKDQSYETHVQKPGNGPEITGHYTSYNALADVIKLQAAACFGIQFNTQYVLAVQSISNMCGRTRPAL